MVYTKDEIAALADVLVKHPDTWVICDDIYNRMVFDGVGYHNFVQARPELRDRVIHVDSLSKTYGMPGWRVGFIAGAGSSRAGRRHAEFEPHHEPAGSRHRGRGRRADRAAGHSAAEVRRVPGQARSGAGGVEFDSRRASVRVRKARSTCSRIFPSRSARATTAAKIANDVDLCNALLEAKGVACVPGSAFGEPKALRISYTCPTTQLPEGLKRFREFFAELK